MPFAAKKMKRLCAYLGTNTKTLGGKEKKREASPDVNFGGDHAGRGFGRLISTCIVPCPEHGGTGAGKRKLGKRSGKITASPLEMHMRKT